MINAFRNSVLTERPVHKGRGKKEMEQLHPTPSKILYLYSSLYCCFLRIALRRLLTILLLILISLKSNIAPLLKHECHNFFLLSPLKLGKFFFIRSEGLKIFDFRFPSVSPPRYYILYKGLLIDTVLWSGLKI